VIVFVTLEVQGHLLKTSISCGREKRVKYFVVGMAERGKRRSASVVRKGLVL
tara:strand:+ start:1085 stop:1240 length:156 start_codon:yes stop_codon:yes gene_type:complete